MDDDFSKYIELRQNGSSAEEACLIAVSDMHDFMFQIRMLRSVYELDIGVARDIAAKASRKVR